MRPFALALILLSQIPSFVAVAEVATSPIPPAQLKYPIEGTLGGVESGYTPFLVREIQTEGWQKSGSEFSHELLAGQPLRIQCVEKEGNRFYIGLVQDMVIEAPLQKVAAVLDDMDHYKDLFPDFDDIHAVSRDGNRILTFWEQHIPVFFIPNVKYQVIYQVEGNRPDRRIYRYQLDKVGHIKNNDGMIVIYSDGPTRTKYVEYDFFDADWGPLTTFAPGRIWRDSVEGIYLSDIAIRMKAEHPDWSYKQISKESRKVLEQHPVDSCLEHKIKMSAAPAKAAK